MTVGFIGLGVMGQRLARNLVDSGYSLRVFARRPEAVASLAAGAVSEASPARLAAGCDVVVTMVTATGDVEEVLVGESGVIEGAAPGTVAIDMSTIAPHTTRHIAQRLAENGIHMIDAPVSGGPAAAEARTLTIMVGGDPDVLERVRPLLTCFGNVVYMGGNGAGQIAKACNQVALLLAAEGVAEAFALAARCGLPLPQVRRALLGGLANSRVLELFGARMVNRAFSEGIPTRLYHKDLATTLGLARDAGVALPGAAVVMAHLDGMVESGRADHDLAALLEWLERRSA